MWQDAALWVGLALAASLISIRFGISVALVEIAVGVAGGNFLRMDMAPWVNFLAGCGSIVLTFLAGAEVDPQVLRSKFKESVSIGLVSFLFPFLGALACTYYLCHWDLRAAQIAGIALSTTSVAVVYAVMVETGLNRTELGKLILAACFVTDLGTVLALGILFAELNLWMLVFAAVTGVVLAVLPSLTRWYFRTFGNRVSEPEMKFLFLILFGLGALAARARSEAVLPAYLAGLVLANVMADQRALLHRMRALAFSFLTPFYFLKAGFYVSLPAAAAGAGLIALLLLVKVAAKFIGVWPLTVAFRFAPRNGMYTTLLMSTGLTFGTIAALYGLTNHFITQGQYTVLVTVVIASAVVPTLIAQAFFLPRAAEKGEEKVKAAQHAMEEA